MQDIILIGSGGCMRELFWQIQELNKEVPSWNVLGYVDKQPDMGTVTVGKQSCPYLGDDDFLLAKEEEKEAQEKEVSDIDGTLEAEQKLLLNPYIIFPSICLDSTKTCDDLVMGQGCIVSMDCRISTNVRLGDFVFLNTGAKICHDGVVGSYTTLGPDVTLAGNVTAGESCCLGLGAKVIQGITIGKNVTVGAGAVVVRNLPDGLTAAGVPAKQI